MKYKESKIYTIEYDHDFGTGPRIEFIKRNGTFDLIRTEEDAQNEKERFIKWCENNHPDWKNLNVKIVPRIVLEPV